MKKQHHYGRNIFLISLFLLTLMVIIFVNMFKNTHFDYLTSRYIGAIMPLQTNHSTSITCKRHTNINITNKISVEDEYVLKNVSSSNQQFKLYYPIRHSRFSYDYLNVDVLMNDQSIDYKIQLNALLNDEKYNNSQDYFDALEAFHQTLFSKDLEKMLNKKVYIYEFINREYPKEGSVRYLKVEYPTHPQVLYFNMENQLRAEDHQQDNLYYINMYDNELALVPHLISLERIIDFQMTGYTDHTCSEIDPNVKAKIKETKMTLKETIIICLDDYIKTHINNEKNIWDKENIYLTYFQCMNLYFQEN